ncbi:MAG: 4-hydroxy-tetrahydrodipicolinate reductase [Firmicutes bacterium]|nr:4-hydroxy-tetrahydrodipicolinate reductase [Bacillota bacterium]
MLKIILNGCNGRMGQVLTRIIGEKEDMTVVAGIDAKPVQLNDYPVFGSPQECNVEADVIIDFSHFSAVPNLLQHCIDIKSPVVVATTGLDDACFEMIAKASETVPVFRSANMSLGINALAKAIAAITPVLEKEFNVEIIEKHHTKKLDSPSGTALLLADKVNDACQVKKDYIYGRHSKHDEFKMTEIGIHAVRGGTIPGEHTVIYAGPDEVIELNHLALSRDIFANGAVAAADFIVKQTPGQYSMDDLV